METAKQDIAKKYVLEEIKKREEILRKTYDNLKKTAVENKFFKSVLDDYDQYYNYIKEEKQKQYNALKTISDYLDGLIANTDILNEQGEMLKTDQENILKKLASVRQELQDITK